MTSDELLDFIKCFKGHWTFTTESGKEVSKEQVIKALEQKSYEDAISRQKMLKYFEGWKNQIKYYHPYAKNFDIPYEEAIRWVKDMPPVNPQPKMGHWEWVRYDGFAGNWHCSECRTIIPHMPEETDNTPIYKWCPMCGAKMQEEASDDKI